jgi:hypothetical protein
LRYFVIAPDGSKFGPADIPTLREWVAQGRIAPDTMLEEEASRQRVAARFVAGLGFGAEMPGYIQPAGRRGRREGRPPDTGNWDLMWSYICSALSIICCGLFIIGGFVYANRAKAKGNPGATAAFIFAVFFLILWIVSTFIEIYFFKDLMKMVGRAFDVPSLGGE